MTFSRWLKSSENAEIPLKTVELCPQSTISRSFLLVMVVIDSLCSSHNYLDACLIDSTHSLMIRSEDNIKGVHD